MELPKDYLSCCEQNVGRNMGSQGNSDEVSDRNKNKVLVNRSKDHSCYKVVRHLAELCPCQRALWKAEFKCNELGCLVEEISEQKSIQDDV